MSEIFEQMNTYSRRQMLKCGTAGLGAMALGSLIGADKVQNKKAKAKRIIYLFQAGGPSQLDMFEYKPKMKELHGKHIFDYVKQDGRLTGFVNKHKMNPIIATKYSFKQYGQSGKWVSELMPHMSKIVDDVCWMQSVKTDPVNHDPAMTFMQTGHGLPGRPALGSWLSYGLGSMNNNLPEFVVLLSFGDLGNMQPLNNRLWGNAFLPGKHQGVRFRSDKNVVSFLKDPSGKSLEEKKRMIGLLKEMNEMQFSETGDPEIKTRINQYEMAFRMQTSVPDLADLSDEKESTFKLYGEDARKPGTYAFNCLMARRMAERNVRYIQLYHAGWDHHFNLPDHIPKRCKETDQATAALITDLKQRGLLDDTHVVNSFVAEFERLWKEFS